MIVVGAGHAGCEAACIAAKMGAKTAMFVIKYESVGRMSCNPSIGGPAKGHIAKEIDALGGVMAKTADKTGIQFRMLNKGKGPAVWSPRSQNDRQQYSHQMLINCEKQENLDIIESCIDHLLVKDGQIKGVVSHLQQEYLAQSDLNRWHLFDKSVDSKKVSTRAQKAYSRCKGCDRSKRNHYPNLRTR